MVYRRLLQINFDQSRVLNSIIRQKTKLNNHIASPSKYIHRSTKKYRSYIIDKDFKLREFKTSNTLWYLLYVKGKLHNQRMRNFFSDSECLILIFQILPMIHHIMNNFKGRHRMIAHDSNLMTCNYYYWIHSYLEKGWTIDDI